MSQKETFCTGSPLEYAKKGVHNIPSSERRGHNSLKKPVSSYYGVEIGEDTASMVKRVKRSTDPAKLVEAARQAGLTDIENTREVYSEFVGRDVDESEDVALGQILSLIDANLSQGLAERGTDAEDVSRKTERSTVYIPEVVAHSGEEGTVYMAKSLTSSDKVKIAWGLHEDNVVVCVDDYDKWEYLLGWEKLKELPHGRNEIREEYGDRLSDELLAEVAPKNPNPTSDTSDDSTTNRAHPSSEKLNLALSSRHRERSSYSADEVESRLKNDNLHIGYSNSVDYLVLFPTTSEKKMTDHWWVAGDAGGGKSAAIANCNKSTFEYLDALDCVMHIDDYIEQAEDYEFKTDDGMQSYDEVQDDRPVFHYMSEDMSELVREKDMLGNMAGQIKSHVEENVAYGPDIPLDPTYCLLDGEDAFWLRPLLRDGRPPVLYTEKRPKGITSSHNVGSMYKFYIRSRLDRWDQEAIEMEALEQVMDVYDLTDGGLEMIETLGLLHDQGKQLYSQMETDG